MWTQALMLLLGSVLSSVLTVALVFVFFDRYYKKRLEMEMDERFAAYTRRLQEAIGEEAEKTGDLIEKRVRAGVLDAVASIPSSEVLQETTQSVVKTGVDLVEAGWNTLLGAKPRKS